MECSLCGNECENECENVSHVLWRVFSKIVYSTIVCFSEEASKSC